MSARISGQLKKVAEDRFGQSSVSGVLYSIFVGGERMAKPEDHWSQSRIFVSKLVASNLFEMGMGLVIIINMGFMCIETDRRAACENPTSATCSANDPDIYVADTICMVIYCIELALRLYAAQRKFCNSAWNAFDALVVATSLIGSAFGSILGDARFFRLVRIVKLLRIFRHLTIFPELYLLLASMASTMRTIFWAMLMLAMVLVVCSFMAVQILHPVMKKLAEEEHPAFDECPRCPKAFMSIQASMVTFFQTLIMGDGIGDYFIPLVEEDTWSALFLMACVAIVYLGFSNLILSVIVEKANEARQHDTTYKDMVDKKVQNDAKREVTHLWHDLEDDDNSNTMSLQELKHLYHTSDKFRNYFKRLDIDMPFLEYAFKIMDADGSGDCSLEDFAASVVKLKNTDPGPVVSYIKYQITQVVSDVAEIKSLMLQTDTGSLAERLAIQDRLEPASSRLIEIETKLTPRPPVSNQRPIVALHHPDVEGSNDTGSGCGALCATPRCGKPAWNGQPGAHCSKSSLQRERSDTARTAHNDEAALPAAMGANALNVFKMTLQEEQRLLFAESQRRQGIATAPTGHGTSSASMLRVPTRSPLVSTTPSREQSEELVDMLKKAYEKPSTSKVLSMMQPETVQEGLVLSAV